MRTSAVTRNAIRMLTIAAVAVALSGGIGAQQKQTPPAAGAPKDFVIPSPKRFTLANGLAVTMVPFGQVPKVTIRLVVEAANVHEQKDQVWLADLTGNMMQEGTTALTADALAREFAAMGGSSVSASGPTGRPLRPTSWPITASGPWSSSPTSWRGRAFQRRSWPGSRRIWCVTCRFGRARPSQQRRRSSRN